MNAEHLRYFLAAARHGSFAADAKSLNMSPTPVSYAIGALEARLSTTLFNRVRSKGLTLTPSGKRLQEHANQVVSELDALESRFRSHNGQFAGELVVGCQESLVWSLMPRALKLTAERHPKLQVSIRTVPLATDYSTLLAGEIDLLVTFRHVVDQNPRICVTPLCAPQPTVMMRAGHPLDRGQTEISLSEIALFPQVMNVEPAAYELSMEMFRSAGCVPTVNCQCDVTAGSQAIVGQSDVVALRVALPASNVSPLGDKLAYYTLADRVPTASVIAARVARSSIGIPSKRDAFISICEQLFTTGAMRTHFSY